MATQVNSTMRQAFDDIKLKNIKASARAITNTVLSSLDRKVGLIGLGQGWNASLSNKTAKAINAGVWDNPNAKMPYDRMVNG